jgi:hypothetical protein
VVVNEIQQSNDIEGNAPIPADLMAIVHAPQSVDPEPEEVPQARAELSVDVEKVAEENPQSRFTILDSPVKKPGVCALCGDSGGDGRQFVDFGKSVEWYGVVYFCTVCVTEAATLLGFGRKSDWILAESNLQDEISQGDDRYVEAKERLDAAVVLLRDHFNGDCCTHGSADEIPEAELVEPTNSDGLDSEAGDTEFKELELVVGNDDETTGDEQNTDELATEQGSDDVSESPTDDKPVASKSRRRTTKSDG